MDLPKCQMLPLCHDIEGTFFLNKYIYIYIHQKSKLLEMLVRCAHYTIEGKPPASLPFLIVYTYFKALEQSLKKHFLFPAFYMGAGKGKHECFAGIL